MSKLDPRHITCTIDAATRLGVDLEIFHTPTTWWNHAINGQLHAANSYCSAVGAKIDTNGSIELSFAELAGHNACVCVTMARVRPLAAYAHQLIYLNCANTALEELDDTPNWDQWLWATHQLHMHRHYGGILVQHRAAASTVLSDEARARGYHLFPSRTDRRSVTETAERCDRRVQEIAEAWRTNRAASTTWWSSKLDDLGDTDTYAIMISDPNGMSDRLDEHHHFHQEITAAIAQYSVHHHGERHLVYAPTNVITHLNDWRDTLITAAIADDLGGTYEPHQYPLILELYEPGCDPQHLANTVWAAHPIPGIREQRTPSLIASTGHG